MVVYGIPERGEHGEVGGSVGVEVPGVLLRGHGDGRQQAPGAAEAVSGVEKQEKITQKTTKNGQRRPLGHV